MATGGDHELDSESGWMVYDEMCWFKLLGTSGFNQAHVSLMCVCLHDNSRKKYICRKWTLEIIYFCKWN